MTARQTRLVGAAVLLVVLAIVPLLDVPTGGFLPGALSSPGTLQILALCLVFGSLALSYDVLFGHTGLLSFGHALYFAGGVYGATLAMQHLGLLPAAVLAVVLTGVLALAVGAVSLRVGAIAFAMVTLAFAEAVSILVALNPGGLTGGELGVGLPFEQVPQAFLGVLNTANLYWLALALLVAATRS